MHIGIDARTLINPLTGIGRYTYELSKALLDISGVKESLYTPAPIEAHLLENLKPANIKSGNARNRFSKMIWSQTQLPKYAFHDRVDLFWGPTHRLPRFLHSSIARVLTIHDVVWQEAPQTMRSFSRLVEQRLMPEAIDLADLVMADSQSTAEGIKQYFPKAAHKIRVVHLGVSKLPSPSPEFSLTALGLTKPYFLFVGTIEPRKNIERLLQAFSTLPSFYRNQFSLVIAGGKGWGGIDLNRLIDRNGLKDCVRILGYVTDEQLASLYSHARFLVMPSLYEGFGLPLVEAMHYGTPVLTSRSGSMSEIAVDAAVLIDPLSISSISSALERMLSDDDLINFLGVKAMVRAQDFSWKKCAEKTMDIFKEAIILRRDQA